MKRLALVVLFLGLWSCQSEAVNASCYECQVIATNTQPAHQTKTFCNKAEMDQFVREGSADPNISLIECKNKQQ